MFVAKNGCNEASGFADLFFVRGDGKKVMKEESQFPVFNRLSWVFIVDKFIIFKMSIFTYNYFLFRFETFPSRRPNQLHFYFKYSKNKNLETFETYMNRNETQNETYWIGFEAQNY